MHLNSKKPSIDWLREVKTPKARSAIRRWLKNTGRQESIDLGKKIIQVAYKKLHTTTPFTDQIPGLLQFLGINNIDRLYEMVGNGELPSARVMQFFQTKKVRKSVPSNVVSKLVDTITGRSSQAILVGGNEDIMVRFAKCCNPIPGDPIIGFITRGRGISVHRNDCTNASLFHNDEDRRIEVVWDKGEEKKYDVNLEIISSDRPGLLHEISQIFSDFGVNINEGTIKTISQQARCIFKMDIRNRNQLKQILRKLQNIKGVVKISRIKEYNNDSNEPS
jgi:GTP pyrophosphokinase